MVDLRKKPFLLEKDQIKWVEDTLASMTLEEKIGQLFIYMCYDRTEEKIEQACKKYHIGGLRWQGGTLAEVHTQNK